ncbi:MAG: OB-fold domain-containing protein [Candidatus Omnitrophica bacterium]|nr:OB-fold domain-containing protein [Candidatus Omnitrophota bacterium]
MISKISGKLKQKRGNSVLVEISGISYEVLVPGVIMRKIDETMKEDSDIDLVTYHYLQSDPSRSVPVLIGFLSDIEKEFFEKFITVSGVGPKAACRALALSFSAIADAIDKGDMAVLKSLPGIGEQRAREIIAKLQGKIGKYGLIQDGTVSAPVAVEEDIKREALQVLTQLQYNKPEAKSMIDEALRRNVNISSCEELLNEIYKQKQRKGEIKHAGR